MILSQKVTAAAALLAMLAMAIAFVAGPAPSARAEGVGVNAIDNSFSPPSITIAVGDTITWTNNGDRPHTTTSGQRGVSGFGSLWDQTINSGQSSNAVSFDTTGTFPYFCRFHNGMDGTVIVQAAATATPTQQPTATATQQPTATATRQPTGHGDTAAHRHGDLRGRAFFARTGHPRSHQGQHAVPER